MTDSILIYLGIGVIANFIMSIIGSSEKTSPTWQNEPIEMLALVIILSVFWPINLVSFIRDSNDRHC